MLSNEQVSLLLAETGMSLTEEQREVVKVFNESTIVFANPGTGKTTTLVAGLIAAQTLHGIKGSKINAMSFTKAATAELAARYTAVCKKANLAPTVTFNTFHAICRTIIDRYKSFNIIKQYDSLADDIKGVSEYLKSYGNTNFDDNYFCKNVLLCMRSLNSEMKFGYEGVEASYKFKQISNNITIAQFQNLRSSWFLRCLQMGTITEGEIPLVALYVLLTYPQVQALYKSMYHLMVVDEFQDMSSLYLNILHLISNNLIVVGDMKQQIYGFNGASLNIIDDYKKLYPNAHCLLMTKSFRCSSQICELANKVIEPNNIEGFDSFVGNHTGSEVEFVSDKEFNLDNVIKSIERPDDVMFLARNNNDVIPIIEKLYKSNIPFRTKALYTIDTIPVYKELCMLASIAMNSRDVQKIELASKIMPEFKYSTANGNKNPLVYITNISTNPSDKDLLTLDYKYNEESSYQFINSLREFKKATEAGMSFKHAKEYLMPIYTAIILNNQFWRLDQEIDYYHKLVDSITEKTYFEMIKDEADKKERNKYYLDRNEGVKCYTIHSAKGLEARHVYLLNMEEDIILPSNKFNKVIEAGAILDASKELQNERNLLYVAVTRAKDELTITYNKRLTPLIKNPLNHAFSYVDNAALPYRVDIDEVERFKALACLQTLKL